MELEEHPAALSHFGETLTQRLGSLTSHIQRGSFWVSI